MKKYDLQEAKKFALILGLWLLVYFLIYTALVNPASESVYIKAGNIYKGFFTEPFETILFIFKDGDFFTFTNNYENKVHIPIGYLEDFLKKQGKKIEDIEIAIHNHNTPHSFSPHNHQYYHRLKRRGFKGHFKIYHPFNGKVEDIEE